jgi:hypothetical protein
MVVEPHKYTNHVTCDGLTCTAIDTYAFMLVVMLIGRRPDTTGLLTKSDRRTAVRTQM